MKRHFRISLQFFADDSMPPEDGGKGNKGGTLDEVVAAYEAKLKAVEAERDLAKAEVIEHKKAISIILNGRSAPKPEAPDAAAFAKSCKF